MRAAAVGLAALALAAGCGGSSADDGEEGEATGALATQGLTLAAPGGPVEAYVVAAPREEPRGAAVYVHGQGGDREQLLTHATWLAARGAVAVTITAPSSLAAPPTHGGVAALEWERDLARRDVAAVSSAVDYLLSRPDVDRERIAFVGWSAGARLGGLVSGSERRIRAYVLMSGGAEPVSAYVEQAPEELREDVRRVLSRVDPLAAIADARAAFLIQNGSRDEVVPRRALEQLAAAAPDGADVRWYDAPHELDEAAYRDQLVWLERELALGGVRVPGAPAGP